MLKIYERNKPYIRGIRKSDELRKSRYHEQHPIYIATGTVWIMSSFLSLFFLCPESDVMVFLFSIYSLFVILVNELYAYPYLMVCDAGLFSTVYEKYKFTPIPKIAIFLAKFIPISRFAMIHVLINLCILLLINLFGFGYLSIQLIFIPLITLLYLILRFSLIYFHIFMQK